MENLSFKHIAIGIILVEVFNLVIVLLTKTETILKVVERIKGVIRLDYKSRAKRSDDEVRISKKHAQVARERVRHTFITVKLWNCKWAWNWSDSFELINIKGYCVGDKRTYINFECNHPVSVDIFYRRDNRNAVGIICAQKGHPPHNQIRAEFELESDDELDADIVFHSIISKAILSERDLKVANEIKKLRLQFWR